LQDRLRDLVKGEMILLENTIDLSRFTQHIDSGDTAPTVGWVGSTAHRSGDIETLRGVLDVMAKRGDIKLYHGGNHMSYPTFASLLNVSDELVSTAPLHPIETYATLMSMDIGIIPLRDFPFNRCKSDIKGMEYAASGIPFIAQNLDAYVKLNEQLGVGRVAKKPADWIKHLKQLIADPELRKEEGMRNREAIASRDISFGAKRFVDAINSL
jgi:glycosyltransferase involved in cell wall biosynthesis